jgi:N-acyl-D-amino-acid deacylase
LHRRTLFCLVALCSLGSAFARQVPPAPNTLLIQNGTVIDGTGAKRRAASVRIEGDHIIEIGNLTPRSNERVIEARGLIVAPGFIDAHNHADGDIMELPDAESHIRQGITTAIVGQDGGSEFPLADWFRQVEQKQVALNIASFVGHGTVREQVIGKTETRAATPDDLAKMAALVEQEMQAGALGLSSGLEYVPGRYGNTAELIACAQAASKHGGIYISHVRNEDNQAFEAFEELIAVAREARIPAQISHIKLGSAKVWGKTNAVFRLMADAQKAGLDISADVYPYTYWQATPRVLIATENFDSREEWAAGLAMVGGAKNVRVSKFVPEPNWEGKTLAELSAQTGTDAVTLIQGIVKRTLEDDDQASVVVTAMSEKDLSRFIASPRIMFCSDGSLRGTHPRGAGSFPRILGEYVRKRRVLPWEEAIRKMTSLPARRMGISERGVLAVGKKADIVLFDPKTVADTATVQQPTAPPVGLPTVLVNGVPVLENGKITGARPGKVLRRIGHISRLNTSPK